MSFYCSLVEEETLVLTEEEVEIGTISRLVVFNDDYNTFDWVITCLVKILGHTAIQAEQLSVIIHFKGKAIVRTGPLSELRLQKEALTDCGLSAVIQND